MLGNPHGTGLPGRFTTGGMAVDQEWPRLTILMIIPTRAGTMPSMNNFTTPRAQKKEQLQQRHQAFVIFFRCGREKNRERANVVDFDCATSCATSSGVLTVYPSPWRMVVVIVAVIVVVACRTASMPLHATSCHFMPLHATSSGVKRREVA